MALAAVQTHHGALDGEFAHQTQLAVLAHLTKSDDMRPYRCQRVRHCYSPAAARVTSSYRKDQNAALAWDVLVGRHERRAWHDTERTPADETGNISNVDDAYR